jgi:putative cardiolipin synthase
MRAVFLIYVAGLTACASLPTDYVAKPSYAFTDTDETTLGVKAKTLLGEDTENSAINLIGEGTDAFLTRLILLSLAERSLDVQYFIWKSDLIGKLLFDGMIKAADRGVRIRILLDDSTLDAETRANIFAMGQHENIEVRIYNPFSSDGSKAGAAITDGSRVNRRMHNKSFTIDGQYTVVGGRNIENNYFSANVRSNYSDLDVVAVGPVVKEVSKQYDLYWNSDMAVPAYVFTDNKATLKDLERVRGEMAEFREAKRGSDYALDIHDSKPYKRIVKGLVGVEDESIYRGKAKVVYDYPDKTKGKSREETVYLATMLLPHIERIENTFELVSPYFVPDEAAIEYLIAMVDRGVKVRVITNSLASTDGIMAQTGYARHRIEMLKGGIELYELKPSAKTGEGRSLRQSSEAKSALHAKTYIFDRREVYIGSFNFDPRSANINTELGVVCEIPEMAEFVAENIFDEHLQRNTYEVKLITEMKDDDGDEVYMPEDRVVWIEETRDGKEIVYDEQPETSVWRRFTLGLYSTLPIESQL